MHDSDDVKKSVLNRVKHRIREYVHKHASDFSIELAPSLWRAASACYCRINHIEKTNFQPRLSLRVEISGSLKLGERFRMELEPHPAYFCRSLEKASSPGMPVT